MTEKPKPTSRITDLKRLVTDRYPNAAPVTINGVPLAECEITREHDTINIQTPKQTDTESDET